MPSLENQNNSPQPTPSFTHKEVGPAQMSSESVDQLLEMIHEDDATRLPQWLESQESLYSVDAEGQNALHLAAHYGAVKLVRALLEQGIAPDVRADNAGAGTPLILALYNNNEEVALALIEQGANVRLRAGNKNQTGALDIAVGHINVPLMKKLIEKGADAKDKTLNGWSMMHDLALENYANCETLEAAMNVLLSQGLDINERNPSGFTPLHIACVHGHNKVAYLFLKKGANPWMLDFNDNSVLHFAARSCEMDMVKNFVELGLSLDAKNKEGQTPLDGATENGQKTNADYLAAIMLVKKEKADLEEQIHQTLESKPSPDPLGSSESVATLHTKRL